MTRMPIGEEWVGRILDERFPLLQWLGGRAECGVFLTEQPGGSGEKAAIKVMPVEVAEAADRATGWDAVMALKQRHLLRVHGHGLCEMEGARFAYVVTEYAPEILAEILVGRALSTEEARAMLWPLLEALGSLHARGLVHGHVKPGNIMAQGDVLKLTMDHVLPVGAAVGALTAGEYDAPELGRGVVTPATDVWSLGVTLVEVLTQRRPVAGADGELVVPEGVPEPFSEIAQACLRVNRAERCGLWDVRARMTREWPELDAPVTVEPGTRVVGVQVVDRVEPRRPARRGRWWMGAVGALAVIAVATFLLWPRVAGRSVDGGGPGVSVGDGAATTASAVPVMTPGVVARRVPPGVLRSALQTISGTVRVDVRVTVGTGGRVIDGEFADRGPSRYFAKAAMAAAMQWVFRPAQVDGRAVRSVWLLKFGFTRDGSEVTATPVSP